MRIILSNIFIKKLRKLPRRLQEQFKERRDLFLQDRFHPLLDNHPLHGKYLGCRSINITGDFRAIYEEVVSDIMYFITVGTHSELYG